MICTRTSHHGYIRLRRYPYKKVKPTRSLDHLHLLPSKIACKPSNSEQYNLKKLTGRRVLHLAAIRTCIIHCVPFGPARTIELRSTSPPPQSTVWYARIALSVPNTDNYLYHLHIYTLASCPLFNRLLIKINHNILFINSSSILYVLKCSNFKFAHMLDLKFM